MLNKLRIVNQRFDEVSDLIIQPDIIMDQKRYVKLNKEYKDLKNLVDKGEGSLQMALIKKWLKWPKCSWTKQMKIFQNWKRI